MTIKSNLKQAVCEFIAAQSNIPRVGHAHLLVGRCQSASFSVQVKSLYITSPHHNHHHTNLLKYCFTEAHHCLKIIGVLQKLKVYAVLGVIKLLI